MSWRTVVITKRCKLDYKMGYLVIRDEETKRIFLDEIAILMLENTAISLTGCLLSALVEKKIKVIFCDEKRNPQSELLPLYGSHDCARKLRTQISWWSDTKGAVWTAIVTEKIQKQAEILSTKGKTEEARLLLSYLQEIAFYDETNREGHAAKVYFNALFGKEFSRSSDCVTNAALNYGYSLLLSSFNREIVANGYVTQLGLFHNNMFNEFNLSCDLMEPFRPVVDLFVLEKGYVVFESEQKHELLNVLNETLLVGDTKQTVLNTIKIYTKSVFDALNDRDISKIKFFKFI